MTLSPPEITATREAGSASHTDIAATTWGACEIRLVADRVASRRTGSTHKVYRDWRFAVAMDQGHPGPGTTLFTVPIDPAQLAASRSRYALVQLANQGVIAVGDAAAFSWSTTSTGTTDPFAVGLEEVRRRLETDGWMPDVMVPTSYTKRDPTPHGGNGAVRPSFALAPPGPGNAGLDTWETEGGTNA